jgi:hypothetical protein
VYKQSLPPGSKDPIVLDWAPVPLGQKYVVQYGVRRDLAGAQERVTTQPVVTLPNSPEKLYVRVAVADNSGELLSGYSETSTVEVETSYPLDQPQLVTPQSGKSARSSRGRISIVFQWKDVPGADHYTLELSNTPDFKVLIDESKTTKSNYVLKQAELSGTVYWRVRAHSKEGPSQWSEPSFFVIK